MLDRINSEVRSKTKLRQWRRTKEVRDWFVGLEQKEALTFLKFDVEAMYPSISEELLSKSLEWAGLLQLIAINRFYSACPQFIGKGLPNLTQDS